MDGLELLTEAGAAGLAVAKDGDTLVIRGPHSAGAVAERLMANKSAVLAVLADGGGVWWREGGAAYQAPILHLPPRECFVPRACSRLGPCERHGRGQPCQRARTAIAVAERGDGR